LSDGLLVEYIESHIHGVFLLVGWWLYLNMKNTIHSKIGWCAGLSIGMAIGVSQSNIMLGIGLGVAFGASLGHIKMKKNSSSEAD